MDTQSLLINILILSILTASSILSEPVLILRKGVSIDKIEKLLLKFGSTVSLKEYPSEQFTYYAENGTDGVIIDKYGITIQHLPPTQINPSHIKAKLKDYKAHREEVYRRLREVYKKFKSDIEQKEYNKAKASLNIAPHLRGLIVTLLSLIHI